MLCQGVGRENSSHILRGLLVKVVKTAFSEKQFDCGNRKSLNFLHHSKKSESLAMWFRFSMTTTKDTAFSSELDEGADVRHIQTAMSGFFVSK